MAASLAEIRALGATWVAIHPYGWVKQDGSVGFQPAASLSFLHRAVELARDAGIELFWKPHLGYWGQFSHRGAIDFRDDQGAWDRFFASYREFIVDHAAFAQRYNIPLFSLGVELEATTGREDQWRTILKAVRAVYSGKITYAANWDALDRVPFWDAVDLIGVHAYFPLDRGGPHSPPSLDAAWDTPLNTLSQLSERHGKPILLAEIGYNLSSKAASEPWDYEVEDTPANRELRSRLIETALTRLEREPYIHGMFWWKWMPGRHSRNFSMRAPEAQAALRRHWAPAARVTSEAR